MLGLIFPLPIVALIVLLLYGHKFWRLVWGRWVITGAVLGAIAIAAVSLYAINHSTSSMAGIGILFVPFEMMFVGAAGAILGYAAFRAVHLRDAQHQGVRAGAISLVSLLVLLFALVYVGRQAVRVRAFNGFKHADDAELLAAGAAENLKAKDHFVLSAIAANEKTPPAALLDIARYPDPGLHYERSEWIDMFDRNELAVMRNVLRNRNSPAEVLPILANSPDDYVASDVCADKRTAEEILRTRCAPRKTYLFQWSLAGNPGTPVDVLEGLPRSDYYVSHGLAYNPSTPQPILRELSRRADALVRQGVATNPLCRHRTAHGAIP
jgi:hypothetical protein